MQCPSCQADNREHARFCHACGISLIAPFVAPQPTETSVAPALSAPALSAPAPAPEADSAPPDVELDARIEQAQPLPDLSPDLDAAPVSASATVGDSALTDVGPTLPEPAESRPDTKSFTAPEATPEEGVIQSPPLPTSAAFAPLEPGTRVAGRFEIIAPVTTEAEVNVYTAVDFTACPQCGALSASLDISFCEECGFDLTGAARPLCELREALSFEALNVAQSDALTHGDRYYALVIAETPGELTAAPDAETITTPRPVLTLNAGQASHVGMVRPLDEDSLCIFTLAGLYESSADPVLGLFIVADGMGGHEGGEVASKLAVQHIAEQLIKRVLLPRFSGKSDADGDYVSQLIRKAVIEANKEIYDLAQERGNDMGSTLTMALVMDGVAYIANVGDSRTYIQRAGRLRQISADHSLVASLVKAGMIEPEEIFTHPERSVIYRSLGAKATAEVDIFTESLVGGDALVVCCDGLWEAIRDEGIEEVLLAYPDPQAACFELVRRSNQAGGEDNISVIVVRASEVQTAAFMPS